MPKNRYLRAFTALFLDGIVITKMENKPTFEAELLSNHCQIIVRKKIVKQ